MKTVVVPETRVRVTDGTRAVEGARVVLARYEYYPHFQPDRVTKVEGITDGEGRHAFARENQRETVYPLMMHGVPGYGWQLCVEAPGYVAQVLAVDVGTDEGVVDLDVTLEKGEGPPCSEIMGQRRMRVGEVVAPGPAG